MTPTAQCPYCAANLPVPEQLMGKKARCPRCRGVVMIAAPVGLATVPPPASPPPNAITPAAAAATAGVEAVAVAPDTDDVFVATLADDRPLCIKRKRKKRPQGLLGRLGLPAVAVEPWVLWSALGVVCVVLLGVGMVFGLRVALRTPPPREIAAELWQPFEVPGRCRVLFPGPSHRQENNFGTMKLVMHSCEPDKDSVYGIGYTEGQLPPDRRNLPTEVLLTDACNGSAANLENMGAKEVRREPVQLGPYPGKQLVMSIPRAIGHMISRCYIADGRLYIIMCGGRGFDTGQANVNRFFESFQILDAGNAGVQPPPGGGRPPGWRTGFAPRPQVPPGPPPPRAFPPAGDRPRGRSAAPGGGRGGGGHR
jgi:hypothetical protein